jgi:alpha-L-fucosidase
MVAMNMIVHSAKRSRGIKREMTRTAMRRVTYTWFLAIVVFIALATSQEKTGTKAPGNYALITTGDSMQEILRKAANVVPSPRQLAWQELGFIAFVHFGTNTFTDREWGLGTESPSVFNPTELDARQWVRVIKDAGMKMVIVTAKHHDGLCLWPSKYTSHSIKNSPWKGGQGDVVGEVATACRDFGLKFGVYLSPWDRHEPSYGDSPKYNEHFRNQLRELLSNYGEVAEVWFDGACGEGPNGKKQVYDWPSYYKLIRELQPTAVIAIMGPDVRWVGTESGYGRETEWSVVPDVAKDLDAIAAGSQQNPVDSAFIPGDMMADDLGSREKIRQAQALVWYPSETDVSIRPGWFYHADQDNRVKTPEKLVDIYYSSVGRNSVLLLNIPPDKRGRVHDNDVKSLMGMRKILDQTFSRDFASRATAKASNERTGHKAAFAVDNDNGTYWMTDAAVSSASLEFVLPTAATLDRAMLQECIRAGQRIERFHLDAWDGNAWKQIMRGTTIGHKRLLRFPAVTTTKVRLVIDESRTSPTLSTFGLFKAPPRVTLEPDGGGFEDSMTVRLSSDVGGIAIYYTLDGTPPTLQSSRYTSPIMLTHATTVTALAAVDGELCLEATEARFIKSKQVKEITFERQYSPKYPGHGNATLTDGHRGSADFQNGKWLGFEADDMIAILDLGKTRSISKITAGFLQQQGSWIFLPSHVTFSASVDGQKWTRLAEVTYPVERTEEVLVKDCTSETEKMNARYLRVVARNIGTCPSWHSGAGDKAWLFVDEIIIE